MAVYLFLSFQGCIKGLAHGKITDADLKTALFAFDCEEEYFYCPPMKSLKYYTGLDNEFELRDLHWRIIRQIKVAEQEGRCQYKMNSAQICAFLEQHGMSGFPYYWDQSMAGSDTFTPLVQKHFGDRVIAVGKNWEGVEPWN